MSINIARSESAGQREFGEKEFLNLGTLPEGKFRDQLKASLAERRAGVFKIKASKSLSKTQQDNYLRAFKTYVKYFTSTDAIRLTESQTFYLAAVAYKYQDLLPLQRLNKQLNELSDDYYWLYLAEEPELFFPIVEVEMFRRRAKTELRLVDLTKDGFKLENIPVNGTINNSYTIEYQTETSRLIETKKRIGTKYMKPYFSPLQLNLVEYTPDEILKLYSTGFNPTDEELTTLLKDIIEAGGIIAGGFPNSLIYPSFYAIEIERPDINEGRGSQSYWGFPDEDPNSVIFQFERTDLKDYNAWIGDFYDIVEMFHAKNPAASQNRNPELDANYAKLAPKKYDLDKKLDENKDLLRVIGGKLYRIYYAHSPDVDIFFTGPDYLAKYQRVYDILLGNIQSEIENSSTELWMPVVKCSQHVTTFSNIPGYKLKFQLIKRAYNSDSEVLAGFDLDSSRSMLHYENDSFSVRGTQSYINSVEFGINPIVPSRQSSTFNRRLVKYQKRGFQPYLVGNIQSEFKMNEGIDSLLDKSKITALYNLGGVVANYYSLVIDLVHDGYIFHAHDTDRIYDYIPTEEEKEGEEKGEGEEEEKEEEESPAKKLRLLKTFPLSPEIFAAIDNGDRKPDISDLVLFYREVNMNLKSFHDKSEEHFLRSNIWSSDRIKNAEERGPRSKDWKQFASQKVLAELRDRTRSDLLLLKNDIDAIIGLNFWNTVDPMTQFTGSFDPTKIPYLVPNSGRSYIKESPREFPEDREEVVDEIFEGFHRGGEVKIEKVLVDMFNAKAPYGLELFDRIKECADRLTEVSRNYEEIISSYPKLGRR